LRIGLRIQTDPHVLSGRRDVGRLQTLGALRDFKLDSRAFIQAAVSLRLNRREMNEDVFSVFPLDKAVAHGSEKPQHTTNFLQQPKYLH